MDRAARSPIEARRGFTLLELLVATAVLALLLVILATLLNYSQDGFARLSSLAQRRQNAQTALFAMAAELRSATRPDLGHYELANPANRIPQLLINPASLDANAATRNAHSIFWQATGDAQQAGSSLVGYFVRWEQAAGQPPQPRLCRFELDSRQSETIRETLQQPSASSDWPTVSLIDSRAPGDLDNGFAGWLADDILALFIRALDPEMKPITNEARSVSGPRMSGEPGTLFSASLVGTALNGRYDSRRGYQFQRGSATINCLGPRYPAAVEIAVISAPPRALRTLTSIPTTPSATNPTQFWSDIDTYVASLPDQVRKNLQIYSVIVTLSQP